MQLRKYRWSRDYESAEEELEHMLKVRKFDAERWELEPFEQLQERSFDFDCQLWCAEGSVVVGAGGKQFSLQPGDALDLPAGTTHSAAAGMTGTVCYESHPKPRQ